ncbi:GNAT family N-acetyltransferase [Flavobacterium lacus]|uniref:Acetyltransferase (GNAT) family protein n=1 Tax=Flavobacterium lacus TaxID=1353778 RepID=A0A328X047_9FLAO|nr:GNAT family N-acetyltransferase [Flavobacterium lacus]RAR48549.1 acetyltransferase (GNAT) family protein [Flavobacterium lacus]
MIQIIEANSRKLLTDYVKFPFSLYKNHSYWVPPLISDELETFDKSKNPAFDNAEAHFYLAYKDNQIVGRIAAIINWEEVNNQQKRKVRFGWWDVIDDIEVTKVLLEKVYELGRKNNLDYVEGPIGFSNLDKVGVLTEGFDSLGTMITWYNFPYYKNHLEELGFVKEKEYFESTFSFSNVDPNTFMKASDLIQKRYELKTLTFTNTKDIMPYVDKMFDLFNTSYAKLASFVAVSERQKEYFKKKYISFINPEYILFIVDKHEKLIAFSIVMPNFAQALQKANGRLFPFGFYHILKAKKSSKDVLFYLIGVEPEYQNKGVTALIFREYYRVFKEKGIEKCIRTPELEENNAIHNLWKNFNSVVDRKRRTYRIDL